MTPPSSKDPMRWRSFTKCAVVGCSSAFKYDPEVRFFRFPKNVERYLKWVEFAKCGTPSFHRHICDKHFEDHHFTNRLRERLNRDVVPSVRPEMPVPESPPSLADPHRSRTTSWTMTEFDHLPDKMTDNSESETPITGVWPEFVEVKIEVEEPDDVMEETVVKEEPNDGVAVIGLPHRHLKVSTDNTRNAQNEDSDSTDESMTSSDSDDTPTAKVYKCDNCNYQCGTRLSFMKHVKIHTGEKLSFTCDVCNVVLSSSEGLKLHKRRHTGEKPFKCDTCGRRFTQSSNWRIHMRTHTGEKPYKCDVCGHEFAAASGLKTHKRTHSGEKPYACDFCDFKCKTSGALKVHVRSHTGERPYVCNACNFKSGQLGHLNTHMKTHTGDKPKYACDFCSYKFIRSSQLKKHVKRSHVSEAKTLPS